MLTFNGNLKVYVALTPTDMRKSFNGLSEIARSQINAVALRRRVIGSPVSDYYGLV